MLPKIANHAPLGSLERALAIIAVVMIDSQIFKVARSNSVDVLKNE
jgi:hypothetical protein